MITKIDRFHWLNDRALGKYPLAQTVQNPFCRHSRVKCIHMIFFGQTKFDRNRSIRITIITNIIFFLFFRSQCVRLTNTNSTHFLGFRFSLISETQKQTKSKFIAFKQMKIIHLNVPFKKKAAQTMMNVTTVE